MIPDAKEVLKSDGNSKLGSYFGKALLTQKGGWTLGEIARTGDRDLIKSQFGSMFKSVSQPEPARREYIEMESIRKKSKLTEEQAAALAKEIDRNVWETVKKKIGEI